MLMLGVVLALSFVVRELINALIRSLRIWHHKEPGDDVLPFPAVEVQVLVIFFMGLAEAAGEAIASGCIYYEAAGAGVLLALLLFGAFTIALVAGSMWQGVVLWEDLSCLENLKQAKRNLLRGRGGLVRRARKAYESYLEIKQRGTWEMPALSPAKRKYFGDRFADRFGSLFDSFTGTAWWFGFWTLTKAVLSAVIITNVFEPLVNASLLTGLGATDTIMMTFFRPNADWSLFFLNTWMSLCNLAALTSAVAFIAEVLSAKWFISAFLYIQTISLLPLTVFGVLEPLAKIVKHLLVFLSCSCLAVPLPSLGAVGVDGAAVAAAAAVGNLVVNNDTMHQEALKAVDESDSDGDDGASDKTREQYAAARDAKKDSKSKERQSHHSLSKLLGRDDLAGTSPEPQAVASLRAPSAPRLAWPQHPGDANTPPTSPADQGSVTRAISYRRTMGLFRAPVEPEEDTAGAGCGFKDGRGRVYKSRLQGPRQASERKFRRALDSDTAAGEAFGSSALGTQAGADRDEGGLMAAGVFGAGEAAQRRVRGRNDGEPDAPPSSPAGAAFPARLWGWGEADRGGAARPAARAQSSSPLRRSARAAPMWSTQRSGGSVSPTRMVSTPPNVAGRSARLPSGAWSRSSSEQQ